MGRVITASESKLITSTSYDGKHVLEFNEGSHRYTLDGQRVKGATTIGEAYPKGEALIRWMVEQGIKEYTEKTAMKKGSDVGTVLHTYAECFEKKRPFNQNLVTLSPYRVEVERVIGRFTDWRTKNQDTVLRMEDLVASIELNVGGRIDTLRERAGLGLILSDYKTSKGIYMSHLLQVIGGYRRMLREWLNMDVPYVEIVTFPKQIDQDMHVLLADANGWVKDGVRTEVPELFKKCEAQFERNLGTYLFRADVDEKLFPSYQKKK